MTDPLDKLRTALANCPSPLVIESFTGDNPSGFLRSSNGVYSIPLTFDEVSQVIALVKRLAHLDVGPRPGAFSLAGRSYRVTWCPQISGDILVVHHDRHG